MPHPRKYVFENKRTRSLMNNYHGLGTKKHNIEEKNEIRGRFFGLGALSFTNHILAQKCYL